MNGEDEFKAIAMAAACELATLAARKIRERALEGVELARRMADVSHESVLYADALSAVADQIDAAVLELEVRR